MPSVQIRGVHLHYEVIGPSGPWLAMITGGRRSYAEFVPLATRIAQAGFRVLLHDRRNTGASQIVIEGLQGEEEIWTDDIAALLQHLGASPAFFAGASSGARTSMLTALRHPQAVRALMLMRITGGATAAARLPEMYYEQFIRAAREGGMAAVCATEQIRERIAAYPPNEAYLMALAPRDYIRVMSHWLEIFQRGPRAPVLGLSEAQMAAIKVPTLVVPGNDRTHASENGRAAAAAIPNCELFQLPIADQDRPLIPFTEWAPHEETLARVFTDFMHRHAAR
jgi:pimeloyl-ACP methyl ester carboxylesterase